MIQDTAGAVHIVFEGALTMRTVDTVHATLREAIELPPPPAGISIASISIASVSIDCAAATEIDLTFIQLLIATRVSAYRLDKAVNLTAAPDGALLDTLTRGGFQVVRESGAGTNPGFWFERAPA
jgi:hypothetical protein